MGAGAVPSAAPAPRSCRGPLRSARDAPASGRLRALAQGGVSVRRTDTGKPADFGPDAACAACAAGASLVPMLTKPAAAAIAAGWPAPSCCCAPARADIGGWPPARRWWNAIISGTVSASGTGTTEATTCRAPRARNVALTAHDLVAGPHRRPADVAGGEHDHLRGLADPLDVVDGQRAVGERQRGEQRVVRVNAPVRRQVREAGPVQAGGHRVHGRGRRPAPSPGAAPRPPGPPRRLRAARARPRPGPGRCRGGPDPAGRCSTRRPRA